MDSPLWTPSPERVAGTRMTAFMQAVASRFDLTIADYTALYDFSVSRPEDFWRLVWDFGGVRGTMGSRVVADLDRMPGARFFPDATLNFADNLLTNRGDGIAIVFKGEDRPIRTMTRAELYGAVAAFASALRGEGIKPGDRVAGYVPNLPEAIIAALGAAAVGAVWSSCSPDFGAQGVLDRFGQIEPKILVAADAYSYAGKHHDCTARIAEVVRALPSVRRTVLVPYLGGGTTSAIRDVVGWDEFVSSTPGDGKLFEPLPFNHPLYILYSSGTTGVPKCIVHGAGGTLIQHLKEHQLHCDISAGDRVFYFTTCGWMMWNWLVSALASGRDAGPVRRLSVPPGRKHALQSRRRDGHDVLRHVSEVHRRGGQGGPGAHRRRTGWEPCGPSPRRDRPCHLRASTSSTGRSSTTSTSPPYPEARTSSGSSPAATRTTPSGAGKFKRGRWP